jgi:hypothetical protein
MSVRFSPTVRYLAAAALVLALALVACSPFGRRRQATGEPAAEPTATFLPTQMPAAPVALVTPTPTLIVVLATPTPTATATPLPTATEEPMTTTTAEPETQEGAAEEPKATVTGQAARAVVPWFESGNVIVNGSFEEGFDWDGVAHAWTAFATTSGAVYAWADETHVAHVSHGEHAQLMRIMGPGKPNQFVGIYQTVEVVPGETYTLTLHGLIRSSLASEDYKPLAFRLQWAADDRLEADWNAVEPEDWIELGWNDVQLDVKNPAMNAYVVQITPQTSTLTLYLRGWSKWAFFQSEVKFYVDGVVLEGPVPAARGAAVPPGEQAAMPTTGGTTGWVIPIAGVILVLGLALWEVRKIWAR